MERYRFVKVRNLKSLSKSEKNLQNFHPDSFQTNQIKFQSLNWEFILRGRNSEIGGSGDPTLGAHFLKALPMGSLWPKGFWF